MQREVERNLPVVEMHKNTKSWRQELLNNEWPNMNEEIATRKLLTCDKVTELRN